MTAGYSLNIERLYGPGIVRVASKHLLRELAAELGADSHIDVARIGHNFILRGPDTSAGVSALAKSLMAAAGVSKCRKGAVTCLELLFTLPASTTIDPRQYFECATAWAEQHFKVPVLSCVAHMDEGAPHAHALLLPLIDGHMVGSDLHGGKAKLAAMQASFHKAVGAPHGLSKYLPQKRVSATARAAAIEQARAKLQANSALNDDIIDALLLPHAKDPMPLLLALGITMPAPTAKGSFVDLMTKPVRPEPHSHIGKAHRNHIGKAIRDVPVPAFPDTCVGKGFSAPPEPCQHQPAAVDQRQPTSIAPGTQFRTVSSAHVTAEPTKQTKSVALAEPHPVYADEIRMHKPALSASEIRTKPTPVDTRPATHPGEPAMAEAPTKPTQRPGGRFPPIQSASASDSDYIRHRDSEHPAEHWDADRGEFRQATGPPTDTSSDLT